MNRLVTLKDLDCIFYFKPFSFPSWMSIIHKEKQSYKFVTALFAATWSFTFSHFFYFRSSNCQAKDTEWKDHERTDEHKRFTQAYWNAVHNKAFQITLLKQILGRSSYDCSYAPKATSSPYRKEYYYLNDLILPSYIVMPSRKPIWRMNMHACSYRRRMAWSDLESSVPYSKHIHVWSYSG